MVDLCKAVGKMKANDAKRLLLGLAEHLNDAREVCRAKNNFDVAKGDVQQAWGILERNGLVRNA